MSKPLTDRIALVAEASRAASSWQRCSSLFSASLFPRTRSVASAGVWRTLWTVVPSVTVLVQNDDSRVALVWEAVVFWNQLFA